MVSKPFLLSIDCSRGPPEQGHSAVSRVCEPHDCHRDCPLGLDIQNEKQGPHNRQTQGPTFSDKYLSLIQRQKSEGAKGLETVPETCTS